MRPVVDQQTDRDYRVLYQISREFPEVVAQVKTASVGLSSGVSRDSFADPASGMFPIGTPQDALLSRLYAEKQASLMPASVVTRIDKALALYGVDVTPYLTKKAALTKVASEQVESEDQYLLPQHRAFIVKTAAHVQPVATALTEQLHKLSVESAVQACTELVKRAAYLGTDARDLPGEVYKYAGMTTCDAGVLLDWVEARMCAAPASPVFKKFAQAIASNIPHDGIIRDRDELIKIAMVLESADRDANLHLRYGRTILDPMATVFNMKKIAGQEMMLAGMPVDDDRLMMALVGSGIADDILGPGFMDSVKGPDGNIDRQTLREVLVTIPADMQKQLYEHLKTVL